MKFSIEQRDPLSKARAAVVTTDHGEIETPIFMPVGTVGTVKAVQQKELVSDINAQIILGNTYHLYLRPGTEILHKAGGLHQFMNWEKPILTDSGGFQVFSLASSRKKSENGVRFKSHIDGSYHLFTPEKSMEIQRYIGGDIIMAFDELTGIPAEYHDAKRAMNVTHRWLERCRVWLDNNPEFYKHKQTLFPIVQGNDFKDLRQESAKYISDFNAEGNAIGGLSVGEPEEVMYEMTDLVTDILPKEKPRYLMGVGTPWNILEGIALGVDMFDCVMPTRNARNGMLFTWNGVMNMKNAKWKDNFDALDENGTSFVDHYYSKAYVRHLFNAQEFLGKQIASLHNLAFYLDLVRVAREHLLAGDFTQWKNQIIPQLKTRL
ncbi:MULTISPECIES: tRNA guanosine(34) transglycosylase Tgt [Weeksella]|uniref:Queuine tRNA-ribosyltransferase n=1 Tax=Weeksella virosa (strain ATCC 43766 / DSM 16922 / JCM 21250 / CCUG 30538 / CDC 9751 / IAM 14551 / NBRC 16016 / NCTC 11634 / CL345/78) TaxID=865938 RepID=F0NXH7_WEEVC|nr:MULTISPECIES: tRNA guanosine(34) transglycosylase Tgt [Weeksella]ADX67967.1 Queuine tRNA-ribosyltransferase [Weeksella virosa DSM 16922]MDK7374273.1 tRNA guanosine(34) transglycosylase Tgt [Weeksella virosa]MDK7674576.1 tRNA guanosine(34) transglycosylase Tgt [Weeksella virosa]OFM86130.1 tRNA-guanine(34) transglycosylase [Weeksella sp. HMSC059D05]SUP54275.1 Queuine tRNA-ribosyltransferase [Weeksella virosa]